MLDDGLSLSTHAASPIIDMRCLIVRQNKHGPTVLRIYIRVADGFQQEDRTPITRLRSRTLTVILSIVDRVLIDHVLIDHLVCSSIELATSEPS